MLHVIRIVHEGKQPGAIVTKSALEDERLSWAARGLLAYLLCKPDNWKTGVSDLMRKEQTEREAIWPVLKELEDCGYLNRIETRVERGKWELEYRVYESSSLNPDFRSLPEVSSANWNPGDRKSGNLINNSTKYPISFVSTGDDCSLTDREKKCSRFSISQRKEYAAAKKLGDGWMVSSSDGRYDELIAGWLAENSAPVPCQECGEKKACGDETVCGWYDSQKAAKRVRRQ
jgi:hypothetical protein